MQSIWNDQTYDQINSEKVENAREKQINFCAIFGGNCIA